MMNRVEVNPVEIKPLTVEARNIVAGGNNSVHFLRFQWKRSDTVSTVTSDPKDICALRDMCDAVLAAQGEE